MVGLKDGAAPSRAPKESDARAQERPAMGFLGADEKVLLVLGMGRFQAAVAFVAWFRSLAFPHPR